MPNGIRIFLRRNSVGMSIIYLLLTVSVIVAIIFFAAFITSVRRGQYDDVYTPSVRMLFDDELVQEEIVDISADSNNTPEVATSEETNKINQSRKADQYGS